MTHTDPIKALVGLEAEIKSRLDEANYYDVSTVHLAENDAVALLAAIEALKPMADERTSVLLNDIRTIADTGGRRIETAMDACDKIVELIDMEARLGPAALLFSRGLEVPRY